MKQRKTTLWDYVIGVTLVVLAATLLLVNVARPEIERRVISEQVITVNGDEIFVEYKGNVYKYYK